MSWRTEDTNELPSRREFSTVGCLRAGNICPAASLSVRIAQHVCTYILFVASLIIKNANTCARVFEKKLKKNHIDAETKPFEYF